MKDLDKLTLKAMEDLLRRAPSAFPEGRMQYETPCLCWPPPIPKSNYQLRFRRLMHYACRCKLPQRSQRRSFPRLVWRRRPSVPNRKPTPKEKTI